jgi:thymidylate synthase ThyX
MKIKVTGDYRDVANSAWISTVKEIRAMSRADEDARRVVGFLVEHHHTSPFECVTITLSNPVDARELGLLDMRYGSDLYSKNSLSSAAISIDLLNFVKISMKYDLLDETPWKLFAEVCPELAAMCSKWSPLEGKNFTTKDVAPLLGDHGMTVELVSFHDVGERELSRATWRVKCPLSISVQILRHRKGSYNMVSGRYKTIRQELVPPVKDCSEIFDKVGVNLNRFLGSVDGTILQYNSLMKQSREAMKQGLISNAEYKRLREFARFVLPEGRMTELYITYYLDDFYSNYVLLRDSEHAQTEHIWIAQEMQRTLEETN